MEDRKWGPRISALLAGAESRLVVIYHVRDCLSCQARKKGTFKEEGRQRHTKLCHWGSLTAAKRNGTWSTTWLAYHVIAWGEVLRGCGCYLQPPSDLLQHQWVWGGTEFDPNSQEEHQTTSSQRWHCRRNQTQKLQMLIGEHNCPQYQVLSSWLLYNDVLKQKRLKLGGGQLYDRSSVWTTAVVWSNNN
jgi:hypothetical protein